MELLAFYNSIIVSFLVIAFVEKVFSRKGVFDFPPAKIIARAAAYRCQSNLEAAAALTEGQLQCML